MGSYSGGMEVMSPNDLVLEGTRLSYMGVMLELRFRTLYPEWIPERISWECKPLTNPLPG
ncbi:MAG: hypothetical protein WC151_09975 [Bacteroidales bacterium]